MREYKPSTPSADRTPLIAMIVILSLLIFGCVALASFGLVRAFFFADGPPLSHNMIRGLYCACFVDAANSWFLHVWLIGGGINLIVLEYSYC